MIFRLSSLVKKGPSDERIDYLRFISSNGCIIDVDYNYACQKLKLPLGFGIPKFIKEFFKNRNINSKRNIRAADGTCYCYFSDNDELNIEEHINPSEYFSVVYDNCILYTKICNPEDNIEKIRRINNFLQGEFKVRFDVERISDIRITREKHFGVIISGYSVDRDAIESYMSYVGFENFNILSLGKDCVKIYGNLNDIFIPDVEDFKLKLVKDIRVKNAKNVTVKYYGFSDCYGIDYRCSCKSILKHKGVTLRKNNLEVLESGIRHDVHPLYFDNENTIFYKSYPITSYFSEFLFRKGQNNDGLEDIFCYFNNNFPILEYLSSIGNLPYFITVSQYGYDTKSIPFIFDIDRSEIPFKKNEINNEIMREFIVLKKSLKDYPEIFRMKYGQCLILKDLDISIFDNIVVLSPEFVYKKEEN